MSKKDEALKLALETFEHMGHIDSIFAGEFDGEIAAIREALSLVNKVDQEQPAQQQEIDELTAQRDKLADILTRTANALKGQPPELVSHSWHDLPEVAQQLKSAQQEPVAWKYKVEPAFDGEKWHDRFDLTESKSLALWKDKYAQPLYTSPPASKPWVGLEEQDMPDGENPMYDDPRFIAGMIWANNKLREKNA